MRVTHRDTQMMMAHLLSQRENAASYQVTVAAGQTHTIQGLTVSAATTLDWGDGYQQEITGSGSRSRKYIAAGTYTIKIMQPGNVTYLDLRDNGAALVLDSKNLAPMVNIDTLYLIGAQTAAATIDLSDLSGWRPTNIQFNNIPLAVFTITPESLSGYTGLYTFTLLGCSLGQAQVDSILRGLYLASIAPRTRTNGTINISGTITAAPSGTFQPCQSPPVSSSTPGKEIAYELLNDSLGVGFNKWATVLTN